MINSYKGEYFDLFKSIFDDAENGICIVDFEGKIIELNNLYADMFGYERHELIDQHYSKLISNDSMPIVEQNHQKIFNGSSILKAEEKVRHKNGTYFYIHTSNLRVNDEKGNKLRITTAIDVTNRLRNELIQSILLKISNLTNHNTPTEELFKSVHEAVCHLLPIKNFTVCIEYDGKTEFPYSVNETGQYNEKEIQAEYDYILENYKSVLLDSSSIESLVMADKLNDYNPQPTAILGVPLNVKNEIQGALIVRDYSKTRFTKEDKELLELVAGQLARVIERKKYEEDLINAKRSAEEAVKLKSDFLAQISHEIRTPLNSILSFSALLKNELQGKLSQELNETFNYIERGGNRLTRTIDLILNVSNSKNNQYKIRLEEIDLIKNI
ncbi:MAG: PAS domain S-box protein, partial [Melioribacteraceae bacterium]|nr:PAS domain S-box protein [Melioribacteraceae bacterium]